MLLVESIAAGVQSLQLIRNTWTFRDVGIGNDLVDVYTGRFLGAINGLHNADLAGGLTAALATDHVTVLLDGLCTSARLALGNLVNDLTADDNTLSDLANTQEVIPGANTETNGGWLVTRVLVDALEKRWKSGVHGSGGTSDTHTGDDVDERVGDLAENAHAVLGCGRGDQGYVGETVATAEVPEAQSLLWRQVDHDEAVGASLLSVLEHLLLTIAEQRVVVSHEHDRCLKTTLPRIADHLENIASVDTVLQGLSVRGLDSGTVGNGVGEGHSKLNDVCASQLADFPTVATQMNCAYLRHRLPCPA
jgi:hypothetical protein